MGDDTAQKFGAEMIRTFEPRKLPSSLARQPSGLVRQSTVQLEQQAKEKLEKQRSVKPIPITIYLGRNERFGSIPTKNGG